MDERLIAGFVMAIAICYDSGKCHELYFPRGPQISCIHHFRPRFNCPWRADCTEIQLDPVKVKGTFAYTVNTKRVSVSVIS